MVDTSDVINSILYSVKKQLGIDPEYVHFDPDLIICINSVLMILAQVGIVKDGTKIEDESTTWENVLEDKTNLEGIKSYTYLKVKMLFDPPQNSSIQNAINEQIREFEWRLYSFTDPIGTNKNMFDGTEESN